MPIKARFLSTFMLAVLLTFVVVASPARAQVTSLTEPAQILSGYLLTLASPPAGLAVNQTFTEITNEQMAADKPERTAGIGSHGRITGVTQSARRLTPSPLIVDVNVSLYGDADGAWSDVREFDLSGSTGSEVRREDLAGVGEHAMLSRYRIMSGSQGVETGWLVFHRGRVGVEIVFVVGATDVPMSDLLDIAQDVDSRIIAAPPGPVTESERSFLAEPSTAELVRGAVRILLAAYVEELDAGTLYREAWEGASRALVDAGIGPVPASPRFPSAEPAATTLHMDQFRTLEQLAAGALTPSELATAAIAELIDRRNDCHTYRLSPAQFQQQSAQEQGQDLVAIGIVFDPGPPLRIASVTPGSPASMTGFRRGQEVIAINGASTQGLSLLAIRELIRRDEGVVNTFVLRNPSGRMETVAVAPGRFRIPPVESQILPGNIGLLRLSTFEFTTEQVQSIRVALEQFEASGVVAWIMDLRQNGGGSGNTMLQIANLFVSRGVLFGLTSRDQDPDFIEASGRALPFQRPLAFLVDEDSASASEILPGALQARGRAIVVGEQTAGCIGSTRRHGLLDGSILSATTTEIVIGPNGLHLHRIGITPDIEAGLTPEDIEAGHDPQLDAAIDALRSMIGPVPATSTAPATEAPPALVNP